MSARRVATGSSSHEKREQARTADVSKAVAAIAGNHVAQLLGYLRSARIETGLLINFGAPRLYVKKYLMTVA